MRFSQTQLMNYATMVTGIVIMVSSAFSYELDKETIKFIVFAVLTEGFAIYNWYQRYKKNDLTLGGFRK